MGSSQVAAANGSSFAAKACCHLEEQMRAKLPSARRLALVLMPCAEVCHPRQCQLWPRQEHNLKQSISCLSNAGRLLEAPSQVLKSSHQERRQLLPQLPAKAEQQASLSASHAFPLVQWGHLEKAHQGTVEPALPQASVSSQARPHLPPSPRWLLLLRAPSAGAQLTRAPLSPPAKWAHRCQPHHQRDAPGS